MASGVEEDWYQSSEFVTVTLKLPRNLKRDDTTSLFKSKHCSLLLNGETIWDCHLSLPVAPDKCRIKPAGKNRVEIKLKKDTPHRWEELRDTEYSDTEIDEDIFHTPPASPLHNDTPHNAPPTAPPTSLPVPTVPPPVRTHCETPPTSLSKEVESLNDLSSDHATTNHVTRDQLLSEMSNSFDEVKEEFFNLKHLPHDVIEKGDGVLVKIFVSQVVRDSCLVTFNKSSAVLQFRTKNIRFLSLYPGTSCETQFMWKVKLYDVIKPDSSSYNVSDRHVQLVLNKSDPSVRWKSLERPVKSPRALTPVGGKPQEKGGADTPTLNNLDDDDDDDDDVNNLDDLSVANNKPVGKTAMNFEFNPFMLHRTEKTTPTRMTPSTNGDNNDTLINNASTTPTLINSTPPPPTHSIESASSACLSMPRPQQEASPQPSTSLFHRLPSDLFAGPSETGIANLGNTCFMSSILQCLSNTVEVRDFFLGEKYRTDINKDNPLGCQGQLAECFYTMIDKLWSGKMAYISPRKIKDLIGSRRDEFSGYAQQDAHEFTTFFLDGLHEDLNRIKSKPVTAQIESDGRPDSVVSEESWSNYKKRNDSFIVDLFGGQFKSLLVCPDCSKESVTFDPFSSLSVPLPVKSVTLSVIFISKDPLTPPKEVVVSLSSESTLELVKASVATKTSVTMKNLRVFEVIKNGRLVNMAVNHKKKLSEMKDNDFIVICEVLSFHEAKEKVIELHVTQRVKFRNLPSKCCGCGDKGSGFKRCSRCKSVEYCSRKCQEDDWSRHRKRCNELRNNLEVVGLPFVISLPITQLTFDNIADRAEKYANWSVDCKKYSNGSDSAAGNNGHTPAPPLFFDLVPIDDLCTTVGSPLLNRGKDTLTLTNRCLLSMDWRNNPNDSSWVDVINKDLSAYQSSAKEAIKREGRHIRLKDCLQLFTEPETLPKENAWYCPRCKEHREATKRLSVSRLPHILIIHLKRFSFSDLTRRTKIDKHVEFPLTGLDMSPYIHTDPSSYTAATNGTPALYDLYATVNHYGAVFAGHYVANVLSQNGDKRDWLRYDDENVTRISKNYISDNSTYLLFYRRRES
ncbi:PREDICTED: ubiquitin carboxyl-terminal hydrolase 19-like [Amphimedon queenslandica]|uniref:ubiquitinyl hydrolase 1 n=1 Tax=Amphimedon queenslandica TaxID=400682 RepID=A0A1X7VRT0_AMPQE|nr:PREDICTED: ubiquitin carboxyl-terminal hydrolase 19-like [Amphimedon queenslandica]|eukprot:XP_011407549.2 PREDICTED: ubiquitin carboxyl-terminal hydrolase 19-like [Amphimedon queenslandica]